MQISVRVVQCDMNWSHYTCCFLKVQHYYWLHFISSVSSACWRACSPHNFRKYKPLCISLLHISCICMSFSTVHTLKEAELLWICAAPSCTAALPHPGALDAAAGCCQETLLVPGPPGLICKSSWHQGWNQFCEGFLHTHVRWGVHHSSWCNCL